MPQQLSQGIITAAIAGFEAQKSHANSKIAEGRNTLDHRHAAAEAPQLKRKMSATSRRRIALPVKGRSTAEAPEPGGTVTSALELAPTGVVGVPAKVTQGEQACANSR